MQYIFKTYFYKASNFNIGLMLVFCVFILNVNAQTNQSNKTPLRFDHLRMNVPNKEVAAKWYVDNVGLELIPSNDKEFVLVADKDHNFMIEFSSILGKKNTYFDVDLNSFHLAFEGHQSIKEISEKVLSHGGKIVGELYTNKIGDYVLNLRDPNGFPLQLIHRVNPFFSQPKKSIARFEHFAFNTNDQKTTALWYVEFMDLIIPWSKDIDKSTNYRNYRVPYVGDKGNHMSFELFGKADVPKTLSKMTHDIIHIAFKTQQPQEVAKRMIFGGATPMGGIQQNQGGDLFVDLYDPDGTPIRLIKRKKELLTK